MTDACWHRFHVSRSPLGAVVCQATPGCYLFVHHQIARTDIEPTQRPDDPAFLRNALKKDLPHHAWTCKLNTIRSPVVNNVAIVKCSLLWWRLSRKWSSLQEKSCNTVISPCGIRGDKHACHSQRLWFNTRHRLDPSVSPIWRDRVAISIC